MKYLYAVLLLGALLYYTLATPAPSRHQAPAHRQNHHSSAHKSERPTLAPSEVSVQERRSSVKTSETPIRETTPRRPALKPSPPVALHSQTIKNSEERDIQERGEVDETQDQDDGEEQTDDLIFSTDREGIKSAMDEVVPELFECYEAWLKTNQELQGKMTISFIIDHQTSDEEREVADADTYARVRDAQLMIDGLAHPMMKGCLLNSVEGLKFEAVNEHMEVHYPFYFAPNE